MSGPARIRAAVSGDVSTVRAMLDAAALPNADLTADRLALVAEEDGAIAGAIGFEACGEAGLLRSLVVSPARRSAGIGARLVGALEALVATRGMRELWLLTIDADDYFRRLGYRSEARSAAPAGIARTAEFTSLCPGDAILMRKSLPQR